MPSQDRPITTPRDPPCPPLLRGGDDTRLCGTRADWYKLAAVLALAVSFRAGALWNFGSLLAEDRDQYLQIARHIAARDGFVDPHTLAPTAYRPPLYPLLLAGVLSCGGGPLTIGIMQLLLGVATVPLTIACGHKLGLGRTGSLVAGVLVASDPLLIYQTALVMTETTAAFLAALLLWLSLRRNNASANFWLGVVSGLACLCRPTFWACGGLAALIWARVPAKQVLILLAALSLVIAPWAIRNLAEFGRPIITTTHGGYTLLLAHNPTYARAVVEQPWGTVWDGDSHAAWLASIESAMARENPPIDAAHLSPSVELARDAWMSREAWSYIRSEPVLALRTAATLLGRMWNVMPLASDGTSRSPALRIVISLFYTGVFIAVLLAVARHPRPDWTAWRPVLVLLVGFTAVHSLYWADMRMRTPLVPALALLAAAGLSSLRRSRKAPQISPPL